MSCGSVEKSTKSTKKYNVIWYYPNPNLRKHKRFAPPAPYSTTTRNTARPVSPLGHQVWALMALLFWKSRMIRNEYEGKFTYATGATMGAKLSGCHTSRRRIGDRCALLACTNIRWNDRHRARFMDPIDRLCRSARWNRHTSKPCAVIRGADYDAGSLLCGKSRRRHNRRAPL